MKCDSCRWKGGYVLDQWECGSGNLHEYCCKKHWEGGPPLEEGEPDPWKDCPDFAEFLTCQTCGKTDGEVFEQKDNGLECGNHHYKCFRKMVIECRSRSW